MISDEAIRHHVDEYKTSKKLRSESGGSEEKLSKTRSAQLETRLQEQTYLYVNDIVAYVKVIFDIGYTVRGMRDWLQRHEFSYKKPAIVPGKANKGQHKTGWLNTNSTRQRFLGVKRSVVSTEFIQHTMCRLRNWQLQLLSPC